MANFNGYGIRDNSYAEDGTGREYFGWRIGWRAFHREARQAEAAE